MTPFPSEIPFYSFLQYSPHGTSPRSQKSRIVRDAVKFHKVHGSGKLYVDLIAAEMTKRRISFIEELFDSSTALVPMPRSHPLNPGDLWPAFEFCKALLRAGYPGRLAPLLERVAVVQKAATANPGMRPGPNDHRRTIRAVTGEIPPARIVVVDDFITRGASFVGVHPVLREAFPDAQLHMFAVVRTRSGEEVQDIIFPVEGKITYRADSGYLQRNP